MRTYRMATLILLAACMLAVTGCRPSTQQLLASADHPTNIYQAAVTGKTDLVRRYVDRGADVNQPGRLGGFWDVVTPSSDSTPLFYALAGGNKETAKHLLSRGAKQNLHTAAALGHMMLASPRARR